MDEPIHQYKIEIPDEKTSSKEIDKRKLPKFWIWIGIFAVLFCGLVFAGDFLIVNEKINPADAIVILSGGEAERIPQAARLYQEKLASKVILTMTPQTQPDSSADPNKYKEQLARDLGIPPEDTFLTRSVAEDTYEEAVSVYNLMQIYHWKSCLVVTDPYHSRRAMMIFDEVFRGSGITVEVIPVQNSWYQPTSWFLHPQGWVYTIREYGGILALLVGKH